MGKKSRNKGARIEREVVNLHLEIGFAAKRVPLSGAARGFKDDVIIEGVGRAEVKARNNDGGLKTVEGWLGDADLLFFRQDGKPHLVVLPWKTYVRLLSGEKKNVG